MTGRNRPSPFDVGYGRPRIAWRIDAGETPEDVAADYDLTTEDVERAVVYGRAA